MPRNLDRFYCKIKTLRDYKKRDISTKQQDLEEKRPFRLHMAYIWHTYGIHILNKRLCSYVLPELLDLDDNPTVSYERSVVLTGQWG